MQVTGALLVGILKGFVKTAGLRDRTHVLVLEKLHFGQNVIFVTCSTLLAQAWEDESHC